VTFNADKAPKVRPEIMRRSPAWGSSVSVIAERAFSARGSVQVPEQILAQLPKLANFGIRAVFAKLKKGIFGFVDSAGNRPYEDNQEKTLPVVAATYLDKQIEGAVVTPKSEKEMMSATAGIVCAAYLESVKHRNQSYLVTVEAVNPQPGGPNLVFFYPIGIGNDWSQGEAVQEVAHNAEEQHRQFARPPMTGPPRVLRITQEIYVELCALLSEG
jgi:hypothetical protein